MKGRQQLLLLQDFYKNSPLKRYLYTSLRFFLGINIFAALCKRQPPKGCGDFSFPRRLKADSTPAAHLHHAYMQLLFEHADYSGGRTGHKMLCGAPTSSGTHGNAPSGCEKSPKDWGKRDSGVRTLLLSRSPGLRAAVQLQSAWWVKRCHCTGTVVLPFSFIPVPLHTVYFYATDTTLCPLGFPALTVTGSFLKNGLLLLVKPYNLLLCGAEPSAHGSHGRRRLDFR